MAKQITFNGRARSKMLKGIDKLARAVEITLGASGPGVMLQHRTDGLPPVFTRDGVTVAQSVVLDDRLEDLGARMLRDVASAVSRQVGDGTTTAVVIARRIAIDSARLLAAGADPVELKRGIDLAVERVCRKLASSAVRRVDRDFVRKICQTAGKESDEVADLIMEAIERLGPHGSLNIEMGQGRSDTLNIIEGTQFEQGYLSPYFATDKTRGRTELDRPYILLCDREINDFMDLLPLLERVQEEGRSLLILADGMVERALAPLLLNHVRGNFCAVAVKAPGMGDRRRDHLEDLAVLTGGKTLLEAHGGRLDRLFLADLGQAERAVVDADTTTIMGPRGDVALVSELIAGLTLEAEAIRSRKPGQGSPTGNRHDLEMVEQRIAMLQGKTGSYRVGGVTDPEIKERMVRVQNAYNGVRAALEEGFLPGGGVGLLRSGEALADVRLGGDRQLGVEIIRRALSAPLERIAINSGLEPGPVVARVSQHDEADYGYDALTCSFGNLLALGVVDPVKVTRLALSNAAGVVGALITSEVVISWAPDVSHMPSSRDLARWAAATREDPRT
jgi:chaperonin GroEL